MEICAGLECKHLAPHFLQHMIRFPVLGHVGAGTVGEEKGCGTAEFLMELIRKIRAREKSDLHRDKQICRQMQRYVQLYIYEICMQRKSICHYVN